MKQLTLRAGPLSLSYMEGELRGLALGRREVVRRIYAAVRDRDWGTVPAVLSEIERDVQPDRFQISYLAEYRQPGIDFTCRSRLRGEADGTVTFTMSGAAQTAFWRNRIGCCVLHPLAECAGHPCIVTHVDGTRDAGVFPETIAPHQPFRQIRALAHEVLPGLWAEVTFTGDIFEMEDQRNWTDASFKTYSTPLDLPFPVWIEAGTVVEQSVTLRLRGPLPPFTPEANAGPVRITFPDLPAMPRPRLGLGMAGHKEPLTALAAMRLHALNLDHLRVDLVLSDPAYPARRQSAASAAKALGVRLLTAIHLSENMEMELEALRRLVTDSNRPLGDWLVFSQGAHCTPEPALTRARQVLQQAAPEALFLGGTNAYFAELNRARPALLEADGAVYSINPQVHAFDDASLMETPAVQAETVRSARRLYPHHAIWVSPVTLKPRFNPNATGAGAATAQTADPRQKSSLAAAWLINSFRHLTEAGAAGVTYFETSGSHGVMEVEGDVFPVYQALLALGAYADGTILPTFSSRPQQVAPLAMRRGRQVGLILANLTPEPQRVILTEFFAGEERTLLPYDLVVLTADHHFPGA